jgi:hypothetical protein
MYSAVENRLPTAWQHFCKFIWPEPKLLSERLDHIAYSVLLPVRR